ncbi:MAG: hypothetical protein AB7T38_02655 [Nitrospirales bacterium]
MEHVRWLASGLSHSLTWLLAWLPSGIGLMKLLLCFYFLIMLRFLVEGDWVRVMYWAGALTITSSVVLMK